MKEYKTAYHEIDTYIYSRFFADSESDEYINFEDKYKDWYGERMLYAAPQFGLLGFDLGMYFIPNAFGDNKKYNGIQNAFEFERVSNWGGQINKSLFFVHFDSNNNTIKLLK